MLRPKLQLEQSNFSAFSLVSDAQSRTDLPQSLFQESHGLLTFPHIGVKECQGRQFYPLDMLVVIGTGPRKASPGYPAKAMTSPIYNQKMLVATGAEMKSLGTPEIILAAFEIVQSAGDEEHRLL